MEMDRQFGRNEVSLLFNLFITPLIVLYRRAILRLVLFYGTKKQMVLHPTHFIRNIDPVSLDVCEQEKFELLTLDPRTGTALSATSGDYSSIDGKSRKGWGQVGELLWIIRSFIYGNYRLVHAIESINPICIHKMQHS
jgi:hypothetical protein